jgi:hypothetical protein
VLAVLKVNYFGFSYVRLHQKNGKQYLSSGVGKKPRQPVAANFLGQFK